MNSSKETTIEMQTLKKKAQKTQSHPGVFSSSKDPFSSSQVFPDG